MFCALREVLQKRQASDEQPSTMLPANVGTYLFVFMGSTHAASELVVDMNVGWNWLSLNVEASDMSLAAVFESVTLVAGDHIRSQTNGFSDFYEGFGFFGAISSIDIDQGYQVKLGSASTLHFSGMPTALPKSIILNPNGWLVLRPKSLCYAQGTYFCAMAVAGPSFPAHTRTSH